MVARRSFPSGERSWRRGAEFSAGEIFAIAEEIERNGARFYRKAAENANAGKIKERLLQFAKMEEGHERIFSKMHHELDETEQVQPVFDSDDEAALYL